MTPPCPRLAGLPAHAASETVGLDPERLTAAAGGSMREPGLAGAMVLAEQQPAIA